MHTVCRNSFSTIFYIYRILLTVYFLLPYKIPVANHGYRANKEYQEIAVHTRMYLKLLQQKRPLLYMFMLHLKHFSKAST